MGRQVPGRYLTAESRRVIWGRLLRGRGMPRDLHEVDFDELAEVPLNGRQIKNVIKTSDLLASSREANSIKRDLIDSVLAMEKIRPY